MVASETLGRVGPNFQLGPASQIGTSELRQRR